MMRHLSSVVLVLVLALMTVACGPDYLRDDAEPFADAQGFHVDSEAEILDTVENRQILNILQQYRLALIQKDVGSLQRLIADDYYENSGTTDTTRDDYGAEQLPQVFEMVSNHADEIKYDVVVKAVDVDGDRASVDYEYNYAYLYTVGETGSWDAGVEVNRLELQTRDGEWKIVSGL